MIISPLRALTGLPSSSMLTRSSAILSLRSGCAAAGTGAHEAAAIVDVVLEFLTVVLDEALYRPSGGVAESTDGVPFDLLRYIHQHVQVLLTALTLLDALDDPVHPTSPLAAGGALAAGLGVVETRDALQHPYHACGLIHHHHCPGTEHRAGVPERVEVHGAVEHGFCRQHRRGGAARNHRLE